MSFQSCLCVGVSGFQEIAAGFDERVEDKLRFIFIGTSAYSLPKVTVPQTKFRNAQTGFAEHMLENGKQMH